MARSVAAGLLAATYLAVVALICVAPVSAYRASSRVLQPVWPYAKCDRDQAHSPLRLVAEEPVTEGKLNKFCFIIRDDGACSASKCCNTSLGVHKVAFQVAPTCKQSVRKVTIDGVVDPGFEFNVADETLRVTGISADKAGQKVCVFVAVNSTCDTREKLFPSCTYSVFSNDCDCCPVGTFCTTPSIDPGFGRPLPPPPDSFPACECIKENSISQYDILAPAIVTPDVTPGVNKVCFNINVEPTCVADHTCCDFDLHKIEIDVKASCKTSLLYTSINGKIKPRFFQINPYPAIKISPIGIGFDTVNNTEICLFVRAPCSTPATLCPGSFCQVAIYNDMQKSKTHCCPVFPLNY